VDAIGATAREKAPQIRRRKSDKIGDRWRRVEAIHQKGEELPGVAAIGVEGMGRKLPFMGEMAQPSADARAQIGRGGQQSDQNFSVDRLRHVGRMRRDA
jgi:hypothetical protein